MKAKKLLAGILSAAMVLCTMALPAFADESTTGSVKVSGITQFDNKTYTTIQEAYDEISAALVECAGLSEQPLNDADFNTFFSEGGKITWTISGSQKVTENRMFSFGRAANRFGEGRHITEIDIIGDDNAVLDLSGVNGTFALPYNWWNVEDSVNTALKCKNVTFDGIKSMPSATYQCVLYPTTYEFDGCTFNGNLYSYQNFDVNMTIKNSAFNAPDDKTQYAFMSQGKGGTITLDNNEINGYTRGINLQRPTVDFIITNNIIKSNCSEASRGAIQITDGASFIVTGNTIDVNGGNAFWFHSAATNENVKYTISGNDIKAPYLVNDDTNFGVNDKITAYNNIFNDTDIENCMEKDAEAPTKSEVTAIAANGWTTDTDSGYYMDGEIKYGMMRFMFSTAPEGTVTASGIKYINANNIAADPTVAGAVNTQNNSKIFQGDVVGVKEGTTGTYYARAYVTTENGTFWSEPVACTVNWNQFFEDYPGGAK